MFFHLDKPGKPGVPDIKSTAKDSASLSWTPPKSDGGSEIFNYVIEYRAEGAFQWVRSNKDNVPDTSYTVKGLKEDVVYQFRIAAENKAGVGPYSDNTAPTKVQEPVSKC